MLGRRPARFDARFPRFTAVTDALPDPPAFANWYADVPAWHTLGNDFCGDCVIAAALHQTLQMTSYLHPGHAKQPTDTEAVNSYAAITGYVRGKPATDQGTYVMGRGGLIEHWMKNGLHCGGVLNKPTAVVQITRPEPRHWQQAIGTFGSVMFGIDLPQSIADSDPLPFVWRDASGPVAGGHEILAVGYQTVSGTSLYDCITWGERVRLTEEFLLAVFSEAVCVYNGMASLDARGINPAGIGDAVLRASINLFE